MNHYFTNEKVKSNLHKIYVKIRDERFTFNTDNGVFSKKGLDFGSRTLIEVLIDENISGDMLDVGCGYGSCGIILSRFFNIHVDMIDINKRAIHLAKMNIKENKCKNIKAFVSNVYDSVDDKYDVIITNPPIRAGKDVLYEIVFKSKNYLKKEGTLYFVINKNQGAKSIAKDLNNYAKVEIVKRYKGFFVIKCSFN